MLPDTKLKNLPRLYVDQPLGQEGAVSLKVEDVHYLRNVLRRDAGDQLRLFNGRDGEWIYELQQLTKKRGEAVAVNMQCPQPDAADELVLIFAPLKKPETDLIIQKATELGVTRICPVIMDHSNTRKIRQDRLCSIVKEAAEQSERLTLPEIEDIQPLFQCLGRLDPSLRIYAALERMETALRPEKTGARALIVGPEGGFSDEERRRILDMEQVRAFSLGPSILRAETAAIAGLAILQC